MKELEELEEFIASSLKLKTKQNQNLLIVEYQETCIAWINVIDSGYLMSFFNNGKLLQGVDYEKKEHLLQSLELFVQAEIELYSAIVKKHPLLIERANKWEL